MKHDVEVCMDDVEDLLTLAEWSESGGLQNRTTASLYIRAMIRGNDALCLNFLGEKASKHNQAPAFFQRLYEDNHISEDLAKYGNSLSDALNKKADMEYKTVKVSDSDLKKLRKKAERFIKNAVKANVEED
ncbi:MAG: hypothetical protein SVV03_03205 [Candidatus Nanohaloarchaea archaeon]|nr:hypothetical protein [Candidatus Nanohaloarchaea archaeon]